jgi:carboxymethylenebutenolidase
MTAIIPRAETIKGIVEERITYPSQGYSVPAYLARPAKSGPCPGVIVGQEAFGFTEHVRDIACVLAAEGYAALVPDYYARTGEPSPREDIPAILAAVDRIHNPTILQDYRDGIAWMERAGLAIPGRTGALGFCTGATYSMILAIEEPALACAVLFYVSQLTYQTLSERKPYHPIDRAGRIRCPTMVAYGDADQVGTPEKLARLEANMKAGGVPYTMRIYKGGGHAFLNADGWSYHEACTRQAWPEALAFLRKHLRP